MRYSVSEALVVTGIVSIVAAALFAVPDWLCTVFVLGATPVMLAMLLTAAHASEGSSKAFCFGALVSLSPALIAWLQVMWRICREVTNYGVGDYSRLANYLGHMAPACRFIAGCCFVLAILSGSICALVYRRLGRGEMK